MRLIILFDLPVVSKEDRKSYTQFHKYLIKAGYFMLQYSVYSRVVRNHDDAKKYLADLNRNKPPRGSVRMLQITEKQYGAMKILVGQKTIEEDFLAPKDILEL